MTTELTPWVLVALALTLASGCAKKDWIDRSVMTEDVTGRGRGTWSTSAGGAAGGGDIWLDLRQDGAKVTGELRITGTALRRDGPIEGRMSGNSFTFARVGTATSTTGVLSVSGDSM